MKIEGLNEFIDSLEDIENNFENEAQETINKIGNNLLRKVKLKTPVGQYTDGRTGGTLRRSWQGKAGDLSFTVSNNVHYAPHVEFPHRVGKSSKVVDGRYMLTKSVKEIEKEFENKLETMIENLWK